MFHYRLCFVYVVTATMSDVDNLNSPTFLPIVFALFTLLRQHCQMQIWNIPPACSPVVFALFTVLWQHCQKQIGKISFLYSCRLCLFEVVACGNTVRCKYENSTTYMPVVFALFTLSRQSDADLVIPPPTYLSSLLCLRCCGNTVRCRYGNFPTYIFPFDRGNYIRTIYLFIYLLDK
jgi:hypothetical protein